MSMSTIDDVAQTLAEYEKLAITSGARVRIDPPEFSADGATWTPFWLDPTPPALARATVYRDDIPTQVVVAWGESLPAEDSWRALWLAKPMKLFGAYTLRAALRRAFREVIGDRREPDETDPTPWEPPVERDWDAEIAAAASDAIDALHAEMKRARAVTPARELALRARRREPQQVQYESGEWSREVVDAPAAELSPQELARHHAFFPESARPKPQDHLPAMNRAARRAKGRKR